MINFQGNISDTRISIDFGEASLINYYFGKPDSFNEDSIYLSIDKKHFLSKMNMGTIGDYYDENIIELSLPDNIISEDFFGFLNEKLNLNQLDAEYQVTISKESAQIYQEYWSDIYPLLTALGVQVPTKKKAVKPRHKYLKSLADVPLTIDYKGSKATVYWTKRTEFVIKSGAILVAKTPLTKAGVVGFAGRFGLRLREEQQSKIKDNILIADVTLSSVNEVGTFLYFAGTNSWLQLKSPDGKTLNELTVVE
ncbi:hypothetical protein [Companilactobacillus nuruki]|uniref:Uncharacterized protein n=1 Tax=Companilactobacillus nuruki TaxID=1993540 RepID=A0A2N7AVD3_9LACO|nr:hypothetical protein [Companilactobacillus nuruki]PMD72132.1 hypothetical protein CBP76_04035 [Companilactobacillus nuruki]